MLLSPVAKLISGCGTAGLIYVGMLKIHTVKVLDGDSADVAIPAILTLIMMPFTYNIGYNIALGCISFVHIKVFAGKMKETGVTKWIIAVSFLAMLLLTQ